MLRKNQANPSEFPGNAPCNSQRWCNVGVTTLDVRTVAETFESIQGFKLAVVSDLDHRQEKEIDPCSTTVVGLEKLTRGSSSLASSSGDLHVLQIADDINNRPFFVFATRF